MVHISIPKPIVERLVLYKRILQNLQRQGVPSIHSHGLAAQANNSAVQVRHDMMTIGYTGTTRKGYDVNDLVKRIEMMLRGEHPNRMILTGIGNLGRAILTYFSTKHPYLELVAAFDDDPGKINRVTGGCRCFPMHDMHRIITEQDARIAIITVPERSAQHVADLLVEAGIKSILNFAPLPLNVPDHIIVEQVDITMKLEKLAYFSK